MYIYPVYTVVSHPAGAHPAVIYALYSLEPWPLRISSAFIPSLSLFFVLSKVMVPPPV